MMRNLFRFVPVQAEMSRPVMAFRLRPHRWWTRPEAASVSTRLVSWKLATEMHESVESEGLAMPKGMRLAPAGGSCPTRTGAGRLSSPSILLVCLAFIVSPGRVDAADTWRRLDTPNFELTGNTSEGELRRVALKFESFRHALVQILGDPPPSEARLPRVFVFKDLGSYTPYLPLAEGKPVQVGGYFRAGRTRPYITLTLNSWSEDPYKIVFHELVHLFTSKSGGPAWFREGYAEFLAGCEMDGDKVSLGRPDLGHIQTLRVRTPFPLLRFLSMPVPTHDQRARDLFYSQAWLFVHYLMTERPEGRAQMIRFMKLTATGSVTEEAVQTAFGADSDELSKALRRYVGGLTMAYYRVPIAKAALPRNLKARRILPSEAETLLADLVANDPDREAEGRTRLARVLKEEPGLEVARQALADLDAPPRFVLRAHAVVPEGAKTTIMTEIATLASRVSSLLADDETLTAQAAAEAEADLRGFLDRNRDSADALLLLAQLRTRMEADPNEILELLKRAVAAQPADLSGRLALAYAYGGRGDFDQARRVLEEGAAVDPELRDIYAREIADLPSRKRVRGHLVELKCDPSGRLDFVFDGADGARVSLRAATPTSFRVFRGGRSVKTNLNCGPQREPMSAVYEEGNESGSDGALTSLHIEEP